jgi:preprotein translocase subunit SecA
MRLLERLLMLQTIDRLWVEHLTAMDEMRQGIGLQAYGQQDPLVAYKREAHDMWGQLLGAIRRQVTHSIYHVELTQRPAAPPREPATVAGRGAEVATNGGDGATTQAPEPAAVGAGVAAAGASTAGAARPAAATKSRKIGRNEPCPCGSGKKYKKCHGLAG